MLKNPSTMQKTRVRSLGQEDPLEKGMTTHSSILAWRIPWTEEPGRLSPWGRRVGHDLGTQQKLGKPYVRYVLRRVHELRILSIFIM